MPAGSRTCGRLRHSPSCITCGPDRTARPTTVRSPLRRRSTSTWRSITSASRSTCVTRMRPIVCSRTPTRSRAAQCTRGTRLDSASTSTNDWRGRSRTNRRICPSPARWTARSIRGSGADAPECFELTSQGVLEVCTDASLILADARRRGPYARGRHPANVAQVRVERRTRSRRRAPTGEPVPDICPHSREYRYPQSSSCLEARCLPVFRVPRPGIFSTSQVFLTRLHVLYDNAHVPEDLYVQYTADRENCQAPY